MGPDRESGIALIMALLCLFVVSTLAVGVMYSTQSEIWTTANYRATTQARYIAEAGAQQALNYLQSGQYIPPAAFTANPTAPVGFNMASMPIMYTGGSTPVPVVLSTSGMTQYTDTFSTFSTSDASSDQKFQNYFATAATQTPFANISNSARFDVALQLLTAMQATDGSGKWLTKWKIVSQGTLNTVGSSASSGKARVQIVEIVDNVMVVGIPGGGNPSPTYVSGVFATGTGCNAISMSGGQYTNSYNSATSSGSTSPPYTGASGNIATYGNISLTNGAYIIGNVFTPFYNVGTTGTYGISGGPWPGLNGSKACSTATGGTEWAVNEDNSGSGVGCTSASSSACSQKTYALPSPAPSYPTPVMPTVATNTAACSGYNGLCSGGSGGGSGCAITIPPSTNADGTTGSGAANFGKVNFGSCAVITLQAGTYNMDSLYISNGAKVILPATGNVIINILDKGTANPPLSVDGGTVANNGGDPSALTFVYAGTKPINLTAGANMFASVYAPNAPATIGGNAGLYGAVVCSTASFNGSGHVIYDTHLTGQNWKFPPSSPPPQNAGNLHIDEFSWSAF
jgi:hypothetical protein